MPGRDSLRLLGDDAVLSLLVGLHRFVPVGPRGVVAPFQGCDLGGHNRLAGFRIENLACQDNPQLQWDGWPLGWLLCVNPIGERAIAVAIPLLQIVRIHPDVNPAEGREGLRDTQDAVFRPIRNAISLLRLLLIGGVQLEPVAERPEGPGVRLDIQHAELQAGDRRFRRWPVSMYRTDGHGQRQSQAQRACPPSDTTHARHAR